MYRLSTKFRRISGILHYPIPACGKLYATSDFGVNLLLMDKFIELMQHTVFAIGDQSITVWQLIFIPTLLVVVYLVTKWIVSLISKRLLARDISPDVVHLITRVVYITAIAIVVISILDLLQVPLTAFAFISGAIAIGVGFGAQNIINNFISGWILMWERPIRIGDFLEIGDMRGKVESINTRSTRIRRVDGVHILIPNSALLENNVVNWTLVDRVTRTSVRVGVVYGSPVKRVAELILQATKEQDIVLEAPEPLVIFEDFGDNALIFDVFFWIHATVDRDLRVVRSNIRFRLDELFNADGIVIAFPQRDVHIDGAITMLKDQS